jgi:hypothetical protein
MHFTQIDIIHYNILFKISYMDESGEKRKYDSLKMYFSNLKQSYISGNISTITRIYLRKQSVRHSKSSNHSH